MPVKPWADPEKVEPVTKPESLTEEECVTLLAEKQKKNKGKKRNAKKKQ